VVSSCAGWAHTREGTLTPTIAGSAGIGGGALVSTARSFTSDARKMMKRYGSGTGGMYSAGGLWGGVSGALRCRRVGQDEGQKEGNGGVDMGPRRASMRFGCSEFQVSVVFISCGRGVWEARTHRRSSVPMEYTAHHASEGCEELQSRPHTPFESWMVCAAGSMPASTPR
jgi:hypothetical protein